MLFRTIINNCCGSLFPITNIICVRSFPVCWVVCYLLASEGSYVMGPINDSCRVQLKPMEMSFAISSDEISARYETSACLIAPESSDQERGECSIQSFESRWIGGCCFGTRNERYTFIMKQIKEHKINCKLGVI